MHDNLSGTTSGLYNSMDPTNREYQVSNFLSIYNPAKSPLNARVEVYDQAGILDEARSFDVRDLGHRQTFRLSLRGDKPNQLECTKSFPQDADASYGSFLTRFGTDDSRQLAFAFPLLAKQTTCDSGLLAASTFGNARNWAEAGNASDFPAEVIIEITSRHGELLHSEERTIAPHAQTHLLLNPYIGADNVGFVRVRCKTPKKVPQLITQLLLYGGVLKNQNVSWAYATQQIPPNVIARKFPWNTYLGGLNWLKLANSTPSTATITVNDDRGQEIPVPLGTFDIFGTKDFLVPAPENAVGIVSVETSNQGSAALVRAFVDGNENHSRRFQYLVQ